MTATATLVRNAVVVPEEPELDFDELRRVLPRRIEEAQENASATPTLLPTLYSEVLRLQTMHCLELKATQVLAKLDIEPYTPESVGAYVNAKLAEALAESHKSLRIARIAKVLGWIFFAVFLVGVVWAINNLNNFGLVTGVMLVAGVVGSIAAMVTVGLIGKWRWQWVEIERYNGEIPEYVLRKAIQVKQALPEGKLWVLALSSGSIENPLLLIDPFLVLQAGKKLFHLEVWGERKFEEQESAKRQ